MNLESPQQEKYEIRHSMHNGVDIEEWRNRDTNKVERVRKHFQDGTIKEITRDPDRLTAKTLAVYDAKGNLAEFIDIEACERIEKANQLRDEKAIGSLPASTVEEIKKLREAMLFGLYLGDAQEGH